jgi:hypothetical protein
MLGRVDAAARRFRGAHHVAMRSARASFVRWQMSERMRLFLAVAPGTLLGATQRQRSSPALTCRTGTTTRLRCNGVQGPYSLAQMELFRDHLVRLNRWTSLRVWRTGQAPEDGELLCLLV